MKVNEKITELRKSKNMTQAELGAMLNISFQAVSKWERGDSRPDFETLSKIAKIFEVPISYFEDGNDEQPVPSAKDGDGAKTIGFCKGCGRIVKEGEEAQTAPYILCKSCAAREKAENEEKARKAYEEKVKAYDEKRHNLAAKVIADKKYRNVGLIWATVVISILLILDIVWIIKAEDKLVPLVIIPVLIVFVFPFVAQFYWGERGDDNVICDIALAGGKVIGTPGIIFSLDFEGISFLLIMKLFFALLRGAVWLATAVLTIAVAMFISPFTFFFILCKINNEIKSAKQSIKNLQKPRMN